MQTITPITSGASTRTITKARKLQEEKLLSANLSLNEFRAIYPTEEVIFKRIYDTMRLKAKDMCTCGKPISGYYEKRGHYKYRCPFCRRSVSPLVYTPLHRLRIPLTTVLEIVYLTFQGKHGLTAAEIARYHNQNPGTALKLKHRIQVWMGLVVHAFKFENCIVQADETYCDIPTGLGSIRKSPGLGAQGKKAVVSFTEDGGEGKAKAFVVDNVDRKTMEKLFEDNVDNSCVIYTDGNPVYQFLAEKGYSHFECNHNEKQYSKNGINVNTCEALNGLLKSKINHVHRGVSEEHLQKYANEITWTFIHRNKTPLEAINSLFDALPPLNQPVIITPSSDFKNPNT